MRGVSAVPIRGESKMREFDAFYGYPTPSSPRIVGSRGIKNRIIASYRDRDFYDGARENGYGGFGYDGRWVPIASNMINEYGLKSGSKVLQIGCDKGFLLHDFLLQDIEIEIAGLKVSDYAIEQSLEPTRPYIQKGSFTRFPFEDKTFDLVICVGPVYSLILGDAIKCLKEIERVKSGASFISLASYESEEDFWLFRDWTVLGSTMLKEDEWKEVLQHAGYTGDYKFNSAKSLNLIREKTVK